MLTSHMTLSPPSARSAPLCKLLYPSWGSSIDWSYGVAGIKWSFAAELADVGLHGYLLPPEQIKPSGEELTSMLAYITSFIAKKET